MTVRLGWFTTGRGVGSRGMYEAVTAAIAAGELDAEFACVFCNREPGENETTDGFFDLVRADGNPLVTRSSVMHRRAVGGALSRTGEALPPWRSEFDSLIAEDLRSYPFDVGMLAGYMLIFTGDFVQHHPLLNLHPALPGGPIGTWREVIRELITSQANETGVMLHLAIPEVDEGSVVAYCRYSLRTPEFEPLWAELDGPAATMGREALEATALFQAIREMGMRYESPLLVETLVEFSTGELRIDGPRVVDSSGGERAAADLTDAVETRVRAGRDG